MLKKIWLKIRIFFFYLFSGMKNANDLAFTGNKESVAGNGLSVEQQKETQSVYKDLLKGEITQEVIELRHEMYFAERASKKYKYTGNGRAVKQNTIMDYKGALECSDGLDVLLVQENKEDMGSLMDFGIYNMGNEVCYTQKLNDKLRSIRERKFTINIKRDFIPRFKLENYTTKIVLKPINENETMLDLYIYKYNKQFDNVHKLFMKQIEQIYMGDIKNDILDFDSLNFITYNAHGSDDLLEYEFNNIKFENIVKYNDSYVLKFIANNVKMGEDLIMEFYDEETDKKSQEHTPRKNKVISIDTFNSILLNDEEKNNKEIELLKELND